jgi:hypothetical protein
MLVSSTGIPLYKHHCYKSNVTLTSMIHDVSCNHKEKQITSCENGCKHESNNRIPEIENDTCCVDSFDFVKIKFDILKKIALNDPKTFQVTALQLFLIQPNIALFTNILSPVKPPDLLYNKEIFVSFCTFLL